MENIVFLPLGSYEQHGKILPNNTDNVICEYICSQVAANYINSTILPGLTYGLSSEHIGIGQTITLSINTYINLLQDIIACIPKSFPSCKLIVLINGHGGNQSLASAVCANNNYLGDLPKTIILHVFPESTKRLATKLLGDFNAHADSVETSVYAAISKKIKDKMYNLEELNEVSVRKHKLSLFPSRDISKTGIITSDTNIIIDNSIGEMLIDNSIKAIINEINKNIELIEEEITNGNCVLSYAK